MKRLMHCILPLLCAGLCTAAYEITRLEGKIDLDGKLDEAAWKTALTFDKFIVHDTDEPGFPAKASVIYDADAFYVGFHCPTPPGGTAPLCNVKKKDGYVYRDDCIEIMLDPNKTNDRYFHFLVNALGIINDRYCDQGGFVGDGKWNSEASAAGFIGDGFWSVEVRIPFSSLDIDPNAGKQWGLNLCRDCRKPTQEASISPKGAFNVAGMFVPLDGIELDLVKYGWETSPVKLDCKGSGENLLVEVSAPVSNLAKVPQKAKIDVCLIGEDVASSTVTRDFAAGESVNIKVSGLKLSKAGKYTCVVSVLDAVTRKIFKRHFYQVNVAFAPIEITLLKPNYRNAIFATQKLQEVVYEIKSNLKGAEIKTGIRDSQGKVLCEKTVNKSGKVSFPVAPLPEGTLEIFAISGKEKPAVHPLRKLPYKKNEVWLDEQRQWRVDGKRFFFLGEWNDIHTPGAKVSVGRVREPGGKLICANLMWSSFKGKKAFYKPNPTDEEMACIRKEVERARENPDLFAYYLVDEPEISNVSIIGINKVADLVREVDPYHPLIISNDTVNGAKEFSTAGEINGLHPYPTPAKNSPKSNFGRIVTFMDQAVEFNKRRISPQAVAYLQQGFNYGDHGASNSRIPTYDEVRTQFFMTLIMGGRGILFYNRTTNLYPELFLGMPEIAKEMNALSSVLLEDDCVEPGFKVDNANVRWMCKKQGNDYWIFAVSTTHDKEKATFTFPALGGRKLNLVREARTITPAQGKFSDSFDNFELHIYTTAQPPKLETLAEVEERIAKRNEQRRKPGNLAFQMQEHDGVTLEASSNKAMARRADTSLWHVTDGLFIGNRKCETREIWHDNTPDKAPDWISLAFKKKVKVGRVVVYPYEKSLKDFEIQAWLNGAWKTVASQKNGNADSFELKFTTVECEKFRLFVTATNGPHTKVDEIELYEK
ncbi:MAG: discoidin domain-containing protein [Victivallales bacterium]|nr:discoidin domain-containing protein [Victivallales bacterium]